MVDFGAVKRKKRVRMGRLRDYLRSTALRGPAKRVRCEYSQS